MWLGWVDAAYQLWSQRWKIARWGALAMVISCGIAWKYPKYESTTQIMPPDGGSSGLSSLLPAALSKTPSLIGMASDMIGIKSTGAIFVKVLGSRTLQDLLIDRFQLKQKYHMTYMEDTRKRLASRTSIGEDKKSGIISISVKDHDPGLATQMANAYVEELSIVMGKVSTSAARQERIFIEKRLDDENKNLHDAEDQYSHFASTNMALDVPEQTKVTVEAAARLQGELIAARAQLEGMKQTYTAENIRVKSAQAHVDELQRALSKINAGSTQSAQDPINPYPSVKNLPLVGVKWAELYRNAKIRETVVEMLTQQLEMARIQEAKEIPAVKVLDPASNPEKKNPPAAEIIIEGTLIGLALAALGYLLKNLWDRWDQDDPKRILITHIFHGGMKDMNSVRSILQRRSIKPDETSQA
jgi:capsule polysaccharide export protein KpsE/RkpR